MIYLGKNKIGGNATDNSSLPEVTSEDNGDLLSVVDGAWAKSEPEGPGYEVVKTVIAPEQSVTTIEDDGFVWGEMTATLPSEYPESIIVTFNGTEYTLPKNTFAWGTAYGEYDGNEMPVFTTYPCSIEAGQSASLNTAEPGTYTVSARSEALVLSDTFKEAVNLSYTQPTVTQETFWAAQSITTEAVSGKSYAAADGPAFDFSSQVPGKLNVVFDGTAYELPKIPGQAAYGAETDEGNPDFTTYPLLLLEVSYGSYTNLQLRTPQAGTYTLEATYDVSTTAPTEKFKEAVRQSGGGALIVNDDGGSLDKTWQEIFDAYISGTAVVIRTETHSGDSTQGNTEVIYSVAESVSTNTVVDQGEEIVAYYVMASENRYEASSANEYPYANSGGGGQ